MEVLPASTYSESVRTASLQLKKGNELCCNFHSIRFFLAIPEFEQRAERVVANVQKMADENNRDDETKETELNELINACEVIDSAVQNIRHAILLNRHLGNRLSHFLSNET